MADRMSFGQWLKQRRKAFDLTREELAQKIGCAANTIYKIEADERRPSKQLAELLADHLNIPANERLAFLHFARAESAQSTAPWGTPFHPPTNLPAQLTPLIGREEDVIVIPKRLLKPEVRLLTLIGPPGIGKTRLALEVAAQMRGEFTDGVFFVPLAAINDTSLVPATIASTLGVQDSGPQTPLEQLKLFLRDKQTLLVLDNLEQILGAGASMAELLAACPWLKLLVTSRIPLRIRPERQFPVSPLAVPDLAHLPDVEGLIHYSAVTLFIERAQAVKPDFSVTSENASTVAAICARLDGLPLAIELISARVKLLPPMVLLERLRGRLMLHSDGLRDIEPRHRTLNAAIAWSYQLLSADEQTLFRHLGVFVGGWTLEAAEAICRDTLKLNVLDGLAALLDKNLIKCDTASDNSRRYRMLETIREYALEQLVANDELDDVRKRHAGYFVVFAQRITETGGLANSSVWLNILEAEHDNFRAALASSDSRLQLAVTLCHFWHLRGHLREASSWLARARKEDASSPSTTRTDQILRAKALDWSGQFALFQGDLETPLKHLHESLALYRELDLKEGIAEILGDLGMLLQRRGEYERAGHLLEESLSLYRELKDTAGIAFNHFFLGTLAYSQGHTQRANSLWEEALTLMRSHEDSWSIGNVLPHLAMVAIDQKEYSRAKVYLVEALTRLRDMNERWQIVHTLEVFACLNAQDKPHENAQPSMLRAAKIFGAAETLRNILNYPVMSFDQQFYERGVAFLRSQLDDATFMPAWAEGRKMTLEQVVAYALEDGIAPSIEN